MKTLEHKNYILDHSDRILITGPNGFIGTRVVKTLLDYGFTNLRCLVRSTSDLTAFNRVVAPCKTASIEVTNGDLLSREDCVRITEGARVVFHLAAAIRDRSFEASYRNNVTTTENLLNGLAHHRALRRFVLAGSMVVYSNMRLKSGALLDETCERETNLSARGDAYCNAKVKQEDLVTGFCEKHHLPYVILRPGIVYGPGNREIHRRIGRRVGTETLGLFLHLGGRNELPLSYVDNCAEAIVLAGVKQCADRQAFNVVDDDLPTSSAFLKAYKEKMGWFPSLTIPYAITSVFCQSYEKFSQWSEQRVPPAYNSSKCSATWKGNRYSNARLKAALDWQPKTGFEEGLRRFCDYQQGREVADEPRASHFKPEVLPL